MRKPTTLPWENPKFSFAGAGVSFAQWIFACEEQEKESLADGRGKECVKHVPL